MTIISGIPIIAQFLVSQPSNYIYSQVNTIIMINEYYYCRLRWCPTVYSWKTVGHIPYVFRHHLNLNIDGFLTVTNFVTALQYEKLHVVSLPALSQLLTVSPHPTNNKVASQSHLHHNYIILCYIYVIIDKEVYIIYGTMVYRCPYHCLSLHQSEAGVEAELGELEDAGVAVDVLRSQKGSGVCEDVTVSSGHRRGTVQAREERQEIDGSSQVVTRCLSCLTSTRTAAASIVGWLRPEGVTAHFWRDGCEGY